MYAYTYTHVIIINARCMREGYCSQFVCLSVCVADLVPAYDARATN